MDPNDPQLPFTEPPQPAAPPPAPTAPPPVTVTPTMVQHLKGTRPWVLFIGILSVVAGAFVALMGLLVIFMGMFGMNDLDAGMGGVPMVLIGFFYLFGAAVNVAIGSLLIRYGAAIGSFVRGGEGGALERALGSQKLFWTVVGILSIIYIVLIFALIVGAFIVGFLGALSGA